MQRVGFCLSIVLAVAACSGSSDPVAQQEDGLQLSTEPLAIHGAFAHDGTSVKYRVIGSPTGESATVSFDVHGMGLDITVDVAKRSVVEDAHGNAFQLADRALMLALRGALLARHPQIMETLHGKLLVKAADRYAEVPVGVPLHEHRATASPKAPVNVTGGCGDDGISCFPGTDGSSWAIFSDGATCRAASTPWGDDSGDCLGRCGIGCSWWDHDYTYDCLDHDVCLSYQSDCSDEFNDAADDWVVTFGPYCTSGTDRPEPTPAK